MPDVAVGDVMQATIGYKAAGQQLLMVRHYVCANLPVTPDYVAQLDLFVGELGIGGNVNLVGALADCLHADAEITFIQVQQVGPIRRFYRRSAVSAFGTFAGDEYFPPNTSAVITLQPNNPGRGRSGSVHVGGLSTLAGTNEGLLSADLNVVLEALAETVLRGVGGVAPANYWKPVMYQPDEETTNAIVGFALQPTLRVMRRRTVGLGI